MARSTVTLLVCLCLLVSVTNAQIQITPFNAPGLGALNGGSLQFQYTADPNITLPVTITVTSWNTTIATISNPTVTLTAGILTQTVDFVGRLVAPFTVNITATSSAVGDLPNAGLPLTYNLKVLVGATATVTGQGRPVQLNPGQLYAGTVMLSSAPANQLVVGFVSNPAGLQISPSTLTFVNGQPPYTQGFTVTATEPFNNYNLSLTYSGLDYVNGLTDPVPTYTYVVLLRPVTVVDSASLATPLSVGDTSASILVYVTIPPDVQLQVLVATSDVGCVVSNPTLTFTPTVLANYFTITSTSVGLFTVNFTANGADASKYANIPSFQVAFINRTVAVPGAIANLQTGVVSGPLTLSVTEAPPNPLTVTFSGNNLAFNPPSVTFSASSLVSTFTVTPNQNFASGTPVSYVLSGTNANWFTVPTPSPVSLSVGQRTVAVALAVGPGNVAVGVVYSGNRITVNSPTPTSFTVTLSAAGIIFTPSVITFQGATDTTAFFSFEATSLGGTRVFFTVGGTDANLINPIQSTAVTVQPRAGSTITLASPLVAGVSEIGAVTLSAPVTFNLTVSLSSSSPSVTITPASIALGTGATSAQFSISSATTDAFVLTATFGGYDAQYYSPIAPAVYTVTPVPVTVSNTISAASLTVGVPFTGITVQVAPLTTLSVTVTPFSAAGLFSFTPASITLTGGEEACFSATPLASSAATSDVTFTSSSNVFVIAPNQLVLPQINLGTITLTTAAFTVPVGLASIPIVVSLPFAPSGPLVLTPTGSPLIFNPASLTFGPTVLTQSFTVASDTTGIYEVSWVETGASATFAAPATITVTVVQRALSVAAGAQFGEVSSPFVITATPPPADGLVITPSSPGLTFSPSSVSLLGVSTGSFIVSEPSGLPQTFHVAYALSGPDAAWYPTPGLSTYTTSLRTIAVNPPAAVTTGVVSPPNEVRLSIAPDTQLILSACAPQGVTINPAQLIFGPGQTVAFYTISAPPGTVDPVAITWVLSGADAPKYQAPAATGLTINAAANGIQVKGIPNAVNYLYPAVVEFVVSNPDVPADLSLTLTPVADALTFSPASVTFNATALLFQGTVVANKVPQLQATATTITFLLSGKYSTLFSAPAPLTITLIKNTLNAPIPAFTLGESQDVTVTAATPPPAQFTLTPVFSAGLTVTPASFTFTTLAIEATFDVTFTAEESSYLAWQLSGPDAPFYNVPGENNFGPAALRTVTLSPTSINVNPNLPSVVTVQLSLDPPNGLTVAPILPTPGISVTPSQVSFAPGQTDATFTVAYEDYVSGTIPVSFALSGTDEALYQFNTDFVSVSILSGQITFSEDDFNTDVVGFPNRVLIQLQYAPPNGLTLIPSATGVAFNPAQVVFEQGQTWAELTYTAETYGSLPVAWSIAGPDAGLFTLPYNGAGSPITQFNINSRTAVIQGATSLTPGPFSVGVPVPVYVVLNYATNNGLTVTINSECLEVLPTNQFVFGAGISSLEGVLVLYSDCYGSNRQLSYTVELSGPDAGWYTTNEEPIFATSSLASITAPANVGASTANQPSGPAWVQLSVAGDITITPSAPGCVFTPSQLEFNDTTPQLAYTVYCLYGSPYPQTETAIPVTYTLSGQDAGMYSTAQLATTIQDSENLITVPTFNYVESGYPFEIEVEITSPPSSPITLTPSSPSFTFEPASVTFDANNVFFTITATALSPSVADEYFSLIISWATSGATADSIALNTITTYIYSYYGSVNVEAGTTLAVGGSTGPLVFFVDPPPINGLTINPIVDAGCTFTPSAVSFGPNSGAETASVSCSTPGLHPVLYVLSGADAIHYAVYPNDVVLFAQIGNVTASWGSTFPAVFVETSGSVSLDPPTANGLTVTPSAPGITFTPTSIQITPGNSLGFFTFVATQFTGSGSVPVSWALSGPDAGLYQTPGPSFLQPSFKNVYPPQNFVEIPLGEPAGVFAVNLDFAPSVQLIVTPIGAGLTFTPASLVFGPGDLGLSFSVQAEADTTYWGGLPVYYYLSGPDAPYYLVDSESTFEGLALSFAANYDDSTFVGLPNTVVLSANSPPGAATTITLAGSGVTFSSTTLQLAANDYVVVFTYTPQVVGSGNIYVSVSGPGASSFAFPPTAVPLGWTAQQRQFYLPQFFPNLWAGVPSALYSVAVRQAPTHDVTLIPQAPDVTFSPATLTFGPATTHVEFQITAALPDFYNTNYRDIFDEFSVSWTVNGTDAEWYAAPNQISFAALPRDLNLITPYLPNNILVNVPQTISFTTTYPPANGITLIPHGPFTFSPSTIVFAPNQTTSSITITPTIAGTFPIQFALTGPDAALYQQPENYEVVANLWNFIIPGFEPVLSRGVLAAPLVIRTVASPPANVTLTLVSDYLEFFPSTLTFTPTSPSATFTFGLRGLGNNFDGDGFDVAFFVGGPAAWLFEQPADIFVSNFVQATYFAQVNLPGTDNFVVGVPYTITVTVPHPPLGALTVTPFTTAPDVVVTPASFTITRRSPLVATFVIVGNHPTSGNEINFVLGGTDAVYYSAPYAPFNIIPRQFRGLDFPDMKVGIPTYPISLSLPYPTRSSLDVFFYSDGITFTPNHFTYLPNSSVFTFVATGNYASSGINVNVLVTGEDADWYVPVGGFSLPVDWRTWSHTPASTQTLTAGVPEIISFSVQTPPNTYILITPTASGVTFTPAWINISYPASSGWFTAVGYAAGTTSEVVLSLTGPDAVYYTELPNFVININSQQIFLQSGLGGGDNMVQLGDNSTLVLSLDAAAINGLWVTPGASGLTFYPPSLYFPPGVQFAHATYVADSNPGPTQVVFSVSGPDAVMFHTAEPLHAHVTVEFLSLLYSAFDTLLVGSTSPSIYVTSQSSDLSRQLPPPQNVTVTFMISPPGAVEISPPNFTLGPQSSAGQFQVTPFILSSAIYIQPVLSGPGAIFYEQPLPALFFNTMRRTFYLEDFINFLVNPAGQQLIVGQTAGPFAVTARSVPTDIALSLNAPGLQFTPSVLRFTGTFETLYFTVLPVEPIQTYITYSISGSDAPWFDAPDPSPLIRVTHAFAIPALPSVIVGRTSDTLTVSVTSPLTTSVILEPFVGDSVRFFPPALLFTPNVTSVDFTYTGLIVNFNLGYFVNPMIPGSEDYTPDNFIQNYPVTWYVREVGEPDRYVLSQPQIQGTQGVNVVPATFIVSYSTLAIGSVGHVNITAEVPPRSDVTLTLIGNNLNFNPPTLTFTWDNFSQIATVTPVHSDYKDATDIPFTVDYVIAGTNWQDFVPPAETFLGVRQGNGARVGGLIGAAGTVTASWVAVFVVAVALLL